VSSSAVITEATTRPQQGDRATRQPRVICARAAAWTPSSSPGTPEGGPTRQVAWPM
jgi:hypothetical protein